MLLNYLFKQFNNNLMRIYSIVLKPKSNKIWRISYTLIIGRWLTKVELFLNIEVLIL